MSILNKSILMAGCLLLLSGCATSVDQCQSWDNDVSLITKMRCDTLANGKSGYAGEVRQREQEMLVPRHIGSTE